VCVCVCALVCDVQSRGHMSWPGHTGHQAGDTCSATH
jgi:hypothetical protein